MLPCKAEADLIHDTLLPILKVQLTGIMSVPTPLATCMIINAEASMEQAREFALQPRCFQERSFVEWASREKAAATHLWNNVWGISGLDFWKFQGFVCALMKSARVYRSASLDLLVRCVQT